MKLSPWLKKADILKAFDFYTQKNIGLLQPLEYQSMIQQLVPLMWPVRPIAPGKKTSVSDIIGYGWQFGDLVKVKMYGWGKSWFRVVGVEHEQEDGNWADLWIVDVATVPGHIDMQDPNDFYHGCEVLEEHLTDRENVVKVKRARTYIPIDSVKIPDVAGGTDEDSD